MKTELVKIINNKRNKTLPVWTAPADVTTEDTNNSIFDITDTKDVGGSMIVAQGKGQATYFNRLKGNPYSLRFIAYEQFINQFNVLPNSNAGLCGDWTKGISRPDYMCYTKEEDAYFIIHELSEGDVSSKRSKARSQLVNCLLMMKQSKPIMDCFGKFQHRCCILSAQGCVECDTYGLADGFTEIYKNIPDPLPMRCATFGRLHFEAYETKAVKLI